MANAPKKDYLFTYVIAKDPQYSEIIYEKMTSKDNHFISFNDFKTGKYYWRVHGTNKTTLTKTNYLSGQIDFVWQQPPTTYNCCPIGLKSDPNADENSEYIVDTDIEAWMRDPETYQQRSATGSEVAWMYFRESLTNCMPNTMGLPYCYNNRYVSWTRRDGLKMIADKHVRIISGQCYYDSLYYFEGSNNGSSWTTITEIRVDDYDYTYMLTQPAVYKYFRIRMGQDQKLKGIEVD